ncbi:MAG: HD domain-containing protein [Bacilli bacterium]|nr:HD domain-containing protein [Bacilli bacterium]
MNKTNKVNVFKKEISYIKDNSLKKDLKTLIGLLPDYFFEVPASSTGKYHPNFALGDGGLVRHTKVAVKFAKELLNNGTVGCKFTDHDKDLIIIALTLHDGLKSGLEHDKYTKFDHPLLISKYIMDNKDKLLMDVDDIRKVCGMIESHMGEWTYDSYNKKEVLPKPRTAEQRFVHMCDYLASRKFIDIKFIDNDISD